MESLSQKRCSFCGVIKKREDFYKLKTSKDGLRYQCKQCDKERSGKWYDVNRERSIFTALRWKKNNPVKNRLSALRYQKKHYKKVIVKIHAWFKSHPHVKKAAQVNRRGKERNAGGRISGKERELLFATAKNRCLKCGSEHKLSLDHIVPVALGGKTEFSNMQVLCMSCNMSKGTKVIDYR